MAQQKINGKDYYLAKVRRNGNFVTVEPSEKVLPTVGGLISNSTHLIQAVNIARFLSGECDELSSFVATGMYPLILSDPAQLGLNPAEFVEFEGQLILVTAKAKTVSAAVPIAAANLGGALARTEGHVSPPFKQDCFMPVGDAQNLLEARGGDWFLNALSAGASRRNEAADVCHDADGVLRTCLLFPNLSRWAIRIEAVAVNHIYRLPAFGELFLQDVFVQKFRDDNSLYFCAVRRDGSLEVVARCGKDGYLCPCTLDQAPDMSIQLLSDEDRMAASDAVISLGELIARRLA